MVANQRESGEVRVCKKKGENFTSRLIPKMDTMDFNSFVRYVEDFKVLICRTCRHGLVATGVKKHFQRYHKCIPIEVRKRIVEFVAELDIKKPEEVELPIVEVAAIEGQSCCYCLVERMWGRERVNPPLWDTFSC
jgi:hypothetical protein